MNIWREYFSVFPIFRQTPEQKKSQSTSPATWLVNFPQRWLVFSPNPQSFLGEVHSFLLGEENGWLKSSEWYLNFIG